MGRNPEVDPTFNFFWPLWNLWIFLILWFAVRDRILTPLSSPFPLHFFTSLSAPLPLLPLKTISPLEVFSVRGGFHTPWGCSLTSCMSYTYYFIPCYNNYITINFINFPGGFFDLSLVVTPGKLPYARNPPPFKTLWEDNKPFSWL